MKSVFRDLQEYLHSQIDSYFYEDYEGNMFFDEEVMLGLVAAFGRDFERKLN